MSVLSLVPLLVHNQQPFESLSVYVHIRRAVNSEDGDAIEAIEIDELRNGCHGRLLCLRGLHDWLATPLR
jgi:hypothetical protein